MRPSLRLCLFVLGCAPTAMAEGKPTAASKEPAADVAVKDALARENRVIDLGQVSPLDTAPQPKSGSSLVSQSHEKALHDIRGSARRSASAEAGRARGVDTPQASAVRPGQRPQAGPRVQRRMNSSSVLRALEPALLACGATLPQNTTAVLKLTVAPGGEVETAEAQSNKALPEDVAGCLARAAQAAKFGSPGSMGASLTVPLAFTARTAQAATAPAPTPSGPAVVATK